MATVLEDRSAALDEGEDPLVIRTGRRFPMSDDAFFDFCGLNRDWRIERASNGDILLMLPAGGSSGAGNATLTYLFSAWAIQDGTGRVFDSSAGYRLRNKATRSPDVSWVRKDRLARLDQRDWVRFMPLAPDFALEFRSASDRMSLLFKKMEEYIKCGVKLAWLLDPINKEAYIYRARKSPEKLIDPKTLSGNPILKGFILDVQQVWKAVERDF